MEITKTVTAEIKIHFDENSEAFKRLFKEYKEGIDSYADYDSIAGAIAYQMARYGTNDMIEGVGYPKIKGRKQAEIDFKTGTRTEHDSPINVIVDIDINGKVDFEID